MSNPINNEEKNSKICDKIPCHKKGVCKIAVVIVAAIALIFGLTQLVDDKILEELKHGLFLWEVIVLVIILNLVSFVCFLVLNSVYRWIKRDFPDNDE